MTNEANSVNNVILPEIVYDKYYKYLYFEVNTNNQHTIPWYSSRVIVVKQCIVYNRV